jgi:SAM-dependent methyltransferase
MRENTKMSPGVPGQPAEHPDGTGPVSRHAEPEVMDLTSEAAAYAAADFDDVNAAFVERLLEIAGTEPVRWILDLGTGPGDIPVRIARARPHWRIVALDASAPMLDFAKAARRRAKVTERLSFVLGNAKQLPVLNASCGLIFSNSILHHITDALHVWGEVRRVARPGAWLFFRDLSRPVNAEAARKIVASYAGGESPLLQREFYRSLLSAYTPDEVRNQLRACGLGHFDVEQVTDRHMDIWGRLP